MQVGPPEPLGSKGLFSPTILIDDRVAGTWKRTFKKNALVITASLFKPLSTPETQGLAIAAEKFGAFLNSPMSLQID